jgi:hypothetical protein
MRLADVVLATLYGPFSKFSNVWKDNNSRNEIAV